jgi:outer membrane protein assembly factor BamB
VWSVAAHTEGLSGVWATPALYDDARFGQTVVVATNEGAVLALDAATGAERWRIGLAGPLWSSPVVVDGTLIQGDCQGSVRAYDLATAEPGTAPRQLWSVFLGGCVESTPAVWNGRIFVGTRAGSFFAIGDG